MRLRDLVAHVRPDDVSRQAFPYIPRNWKEYPQVPGLLRGAGYSEKQIREGFTMSRADVCAAFRNPGGAGAVALAPIWGYPGGVAGPGNRRPLQAVMESAGSISAQLREHAGRQPGVGAVLASLTIPHIGLSTLSKILYFSGLECREGALLIYDQMVMRALHRYGFEEYGPWPAYAATQQIATYAAFIQRTNQAALVLGCSPDVIEYALFREGQRLGMPQVPAAAESDPTDENAWLAAPGFTVHATAGGRSAFSYRIDASNNVMLRFGRKGKITLGADQIAQLAGEFSRREVKLTGGGDSLETWLSRHVTKVRISSYLVPVLVLLGYAVRGRNGLKFH
ncbi:MAG: 8-oxoguanine DNA glycosylase OGG fold protein [Telluria sp.]